ncbi:MAG: DMP19 family protein [Saprospiraceae bacterium]|nr:DMP19 family protein [Saprospiraceae bacterium]
MDKLTEEQKLFYYNQCLEREINNGGFNQYFFNSSGDFAHKTVQSLKTIGANKTADILQKAIDQFPNSNVPEDRTERQEILEQIQETADQVWEELDQKFFSYEDDLNTLNIEFARKNKDKF